MSQLILLLLALLPLQVFAENSFKLAFEAQEALYDGKSITLDGDVFLEHELGTVSAQHGVLRGSADEKKFQLNQADLYKQVRFALNKGGELTCAEAHLDQKSNLGEFFGSDEQPFVVYMEECKVGCEHCPLVLKSAMMSIEFTPVASSYIKAINAQRNVTVDYNHDFIAAADRATYHHEKAEVPCQRGLSGVICLRSEGEQGHCYVTNRNGDLIHARQMFVDTNRGRLCFIHPKGALFADREGLSKERIDFSADTLNWDEKLAILVLRGHVAISQKGLGQLTTDDEVKLIQNSANKQLSMIESSGHTIFSRNTETSSHEVHCYGKTTLDHPQLAVHMQSPDLEQQVHYRDQNGDLYADQALLKYDLAEGSVTPEKLILEGNVKMVNKAKGQNSVQYIVADRAEFFPDTQEAFVTAKEGGRVLVLDEVNDLKISAHGLKIKRDAISKKDAIEGVGDVRFNLLDPECERLYKRFKDILEFKG